MMVMFATGLTSVSAQEVQVLINKRFPTPLPATVTSYLDNPLYYFNVYFTLLNGAENLQIYFDFNLTVDSNPEFYVRTNPNILPYAPITLTQGGNPLMNKDLLRDQIIGRTETNVDYSNPMNAQQLPEGNYKICVNVYRWQDRMLRTRELIGSDCFEFVICYSGSAPELVSPMTGAQPSLNGAMVVPAERRINFFWSPAISNCAGSTIRFKYMLKVVKVMNGQSYEDAITRNPTVFSAEVRNNTYAVFDTLRDIKVHLEQGCLYVAQVQAEQLNAPGNNGNFKLANEGNSQLMPFYWGKADNLSNTVYTGTQDVSHVPGGATGSYGGYVLEEEEDDEEDEESEGIEGLTLWEGGAEEVSGLETIANEMKEQYLAGFIQDASTVSSLLASYPEEKQYVPVPKRRYVESDGYYTVPVTNDLEVSFMPVRHDELKNVSYTIELYDYVEGGLDSITAYEPLFVEEIPELPESQTKMDSHELISRTLTGWGAGLEKGYLYYLQLTSHFTLDYWDYVIADTNYYVNEMLAEHIHDTISREFFEGEQLQMSNGVFFQWGEDLDQPSFTAPQFTAPVDRSKDDIYDPKCMDMPATLPEVQLGNSFPITWTRLVGLESGDSVMYEVNVFELKKGQTVEEAIAENYAVVSRTLVGKTQISNRDFEFFDALKPKKTYVMTLNTSADGESGTYYHFENGSDALPIVFKLVK